MAGWQPTYRGGSNHTENPYAGQAVHDAYIQVGEEGAEAAVRTAVTVVAISESPEPERSVVGHPFLFMVVGDKSGAVLSMGLVSDPSG